MSDFKERIIDRETFIGTGNCIKIAPEIFEFDEERIVSFKKDAVVLEQTVIKEACSVCPVNALGVFENSGRQIVP